MNFKKIFALLLCVAALCVTLVACNMFGKGNTEEVTTDSASQVENDTGADKKNENATTEDVTSAESETVERFDYFAVENYSEYVKLDKSVYENMTVELEDKYTATESQIQEYIDYVLFNSKTVKNNGAKVTSEAIKRGDSAFIFYRGVMLNEESGEYEEFKDGSNMSSATPYELSIGSGSFIDGFEEGLIGIVPSGTSPENLVELNLRFPDNYGKAELAGKDVIFYVYVSWIVQYDIPEYNEDFIKNVLKYTPTTDDVVSEHKDFIRKSIQTELDSNKEEAIELAMWNILFDKSEILQYPQCEVDYFYNSYYAELDNAMMYYIYYGYEFKTLDEFAVWYLGLEENADWKAIVMDKAKQTVAQALIYHAISEETNSRLTEQEFDTAVNIIIENYKKSGKEYTREEVIELVGETMIKEGLVYEKVVQYIKERAEITYKTVE